ncbi:MAG: hypothetical protein JWP80_4934 [Pseudomonas sp.]|nr:hypothetical protein [Pseudomonas sp.]
MFYLMLPLLWGCDMSNAALGIMIISIIGVFGLATVVFDRLSARHSKGRKVAADVKRPIEKVGG